MLRTRIQFQSYIPLKDMLRGRMLLPEGPMLLQSWILLSFVEAVGFVCGFVSRSCHSRL